MTEQLIKHIESSEPLSAIADMVCDRIFFRDLDRYDAAFELRHLLTQAFDFDASLWHSVRGVNFADVIDHFMHEKYENN